MAFPVLCCVDMTYMNSSFLVSCITITFHKVSNKKFCSLGLNPITLEVGLLDEVVNIAGKYQGRCDKTKVLPSSFWNKDRAAAAASDKSRYYTYYLSTTFH